MSEELAIKIQAYLDGELSQEDSLQLLAQLEKDSQAKELLESLKLEQATLKNIGEKDHSMPVAHSYFWKGISQAIDQESVRHESKDDVTSSANFPGWLSWLIPVGVAGCFAIVAFQNGYLESVVESIRSTGKKAARRAPSFHEIDSRQQNAGFISFRSESEGVSVVWISNY